MGLRALGIEPRQAMLTTPLTAFPTTLAILRAGGVPVFVDADEHGILDLDARNALLQERSDIRYCVPVHLYGQSVESEVVGSVGAATAYSFCPRKNLGAFGDAGRSPAVANRSWPVLDR
jgi:dTDP-4-amino-4,6-dideoxygalactose transaminase